MHCVSALPVRMTRAGFLAVLGSHSLSALTLLPLVGWGGVRGHSGPTGPWLVSYPLHKALGFRRCTCSLAVVLYLLVSLLGIVVFVVFSKIYIVLGGDFHCSTHAAILALP